MPRARSEIISWVASHILPHESAVRRWLSARVAAGEDVEDVIQEAYCRIAELDDVAHIGNGRAYLYETVRNIAAENARRSRVVRFESLSSDDLVVLPDEAATPERIVAASRRLQLVQRLIQALPERCREVFILRRVYDIPQREIARRLGISESTVEMHITRGIRSVVQALATAEGTSLDPTTADDHYVRTRKQRRS